MCDATRIACPVVCQPACSACGALHHIGITQTPLLAMDLGYSLVLVDFSNTTVLFKHDSEQLSFPVLQDFTVDSDAAFFEMMRSDARSLLNDFTGNRFDVHVLYESMSEWDQDPPSLLLECMCSCTKKQKCRQVGRRNLSGFPYTVFCTNAQGRALGTVVGTTWMVDVVEICADA